MKEDKQLQDLIKIAKRNYVPSEQDYFSEDLFAIAEYVIIKYSRNGSEKIISHIISSRITELTALKAEIEENQKGQFEDSGGNICWYLDDLLEKFDTVINKLKD